MIVNKIKKVYDDVNNFTFLSGDVSLIYFLNRLKHNYGPSHIEWYSNGTINVIQYYQVDKQYKINKPVLVQWYTNEQLCYIAYSYCNSKQKRYPYKIKWNLNGQLKEISYQGSNVYRTPISIYFI